MKQLLLITLMVGLISCVQSKKENPSLEKNDRNDKLIERKISLKYPISVEYSENHKNSGFPDTLYFNLNDERILLTPNGKAYNSKDSLIFDMKIENEIEYIYFQKLDSDLVAIFVETDGDSSGGRVKRISLKTGSIQWSINCGGFNMHCPVIIDNYAYISTIGFVCKLDMNSGEFKWKFDDLYVNGKYNDFEEPKFFENNKVLFLSKAYGKNYADSILIDDNEGTILKKN